MSITVAIIMFGYNIAKLNCFVALSCVGLWRRQFRAIVSLGCPSDVNDQRKFRLSADQ